MLECLRDLTVDNCRSLVGWFEAGDSVIAALVSKRATAAAAATAAVKAQAQEAQLKAQGEELGTRDSTRTRDLYASLSRLAIIHVYFQVHLK